jgi:hypothetical protein
MIAILEHLSQDRTMGSCRSAAFLVVLAAAESGIGFAQSPPTVIPVGAAIRVRAPDVGGGVMTGKFLGVSESMLMLETPTGTSRLPLAALTEVRHVNGTRRRVLEGAVLGYLAGVTVAGVVSGQDSHSNDRPATIGALVGLGAGMLLGYTRTDPRWEAVSLRTLRPGPISGMRVRVRLPDGRRIEGHVMDDAGGGLAVQPRNGPLIRLPAAEAEAVEWPMAQRRATARGLGIGFGVGALSGIVLGAASGGECSSQSFLCFDSGEMALLAGTALGVAGGTVGALIGYGSRVTIWEGAPDARGRSVTLTPRLDARSVGFRLAIQH